MWGSDETPGWLATGDEILPRYIYIYIIGIIYIYIWIQCEDLRSPTLMRVTYVTSHVDVSKNSGTPKWMVKIMENLILSGGKPPIFWNTHVKITRFFLSFQTPKVFPRGLGPLIEGPGRRAGGYSGPEDPGGTAGGTVEVDPLLGVLKWCFS